MSECVCVCACVCVAADGFRHTVRTTGTGVSRHNVVPFEDEHHNVGARSAACAGIKISFGLRILVCLFSVCAHSRVFALLNALMRRCHQGNSSTAAEYRHKQTNTRQ